MHKSYVATIEFSRNVLTEFAKFSDEKYLALKGLEHVVSSLRDQDAITVPERHR